MNQHQIKTPGKKVPRFVPHGIRPVNKNMYERFLKKFPEHVGLTYLKFKEIIDTFHNHLFKGVTENPDGIELGEGLGFIFMGNCERPRKKNVDYQKSMEIGVRIEHQNWDTDNKLLKIFYTNHHSKYPFRNKQVWFFKASRCHRALCSAAFRKDWAKYIVVENTRKISEMFQKQRTREIAIQKTVIPVDYNEFNIE